MWESPLPARNLRSSNATQSDLKEILNVSAVQVKEPNTRIYPGESELEVSIRSIERTH